MNDALGTRMKEFYENRLKDIVYQLKLCYRKITSPAKMILSDDVIPLRPIEHHMYHIGLALTIVLIAGLYIPQFWVNVALDAGFIIKKLFEKRSKGQSKIAFFKDAFTDFNQYQMIWVLFYAMVGDSISAIKVFIIILIIYIYTIEWAYP